MKIFLSRHVLFAALLASASSAHAILPESVEQLLQAAHIPDTAVGALVLRGDATLVSHQANTAMQPASTMKVLTTMAALEQLGPTFRGRTELRSSADVVDGVLQGTLYLRGGADVDFNEDALRHLLQELRSHGVKQIKGDIVLDRQLFQPARADLGATPFDEYPDAYYNVAPDALLTNSNLLKIELNSSDKKIDTIMLPELDKVGIRSALKLSDAPCASWETGWKAPGYVRDGEQLRIVLRGSFPKSCNKSTWVNVLDRQDYVEHMLRGLWSKLGGTFKGAVVEASAATATPADSRLLAEHRSRPLPEVLRDTNKQSDNVLARTIYLSLGSLEADAALGSHPLQFNDAGTTAARAEVAVRAWMQRHHIDEQGLVLENGSGLSRLERISPAQLAAVLQVAQHSLWAPEFLSSLPIVGLDGTMGKRLKDSPAALRARLKSGTLNGVMALAGYVPDANGQSCIVVVMINSDQIAGGIGRNILDTLIDWVARSGAASPR